MRKGKHIIFAILALSFVFVLSSCSQLLDFLNNNNSTEVKKTTKAEESTTTSTPTTTIEASTTDQSTSSSTSTSVTTYTVKFNSEGGSSVNDVPVQNGNKVTAPTNPTRSGCIFLGWYTSYNYTSKYNFNNTVTRDLTLYAKWEINNCSLGSSSTSEIYNNGVSLFTTLTNNTGFDIYSLENLRITVKNSSTNYECADAYFNFTPTNYYSNGQAGYSYKYFKNGTRINNFDFFFNTSCCNLSYWQNNSFSYTMSMTYSAIVCPTELK